MIDFWAISQCLYNGRNRFRVICGMGQKALFVILFTALTFAPMVNDEVLANTNKPEMFNHVCIDGTPISYPLRDSNPCRLRERI